MACFMTACIAGVLSNEPSFALEDFTSGL